MDSISSPKYPIESIVDRHLRWTGSEPTLPLELVSMTPELNSTKRKLYSGVNLRDLTRMFDCDRIPRKKATNLELPPHRTRRIFGAGDYAWASGPRTDARGHGDNGLRSTALTWAGHAVTWGLSSNIRSNPRITTAQEQVTKAHECPWRHTSAPTIR
jgi:hypothetical protein